MKKRILVVTYYWPPTGGSGVQRWLKFVKYLHQFGWSPVVYTPENPESPTLDESMLKDIPADLEVLKTPIWEPFNAYKMLVSKNRNEKINAGFLSEGGQKKKWLQNFAVWVRGNFFIPDARKYWVRPSVKFLDDYLKKHPVDVVVTTGPPHSMHLIALGLKKKHRFLWLADFRDPWTNIDFYKDLKLTASADRKHRRLEKSVLQAADITVCIGKTLGDELKELGAKRVEVITNGYDPEDMPELDVKKDTRFSIAHIGTLNKSRNPELLWKALSALVKENEAFEKKLEIKLVGKVDVSVKESLAAFKLEKYVRSIPYLEHDEAIAEQKRSHVLLLLVNKTPNAKGILTGKIFEYIGSRTPVLGIGPADGDAAEILVETDSGKMIDFDDVEGLKTCILRFFQGTERLSFSGVEKYSRKYLAEKLVKLLGEG